MFGKRLKFYSIGLIIGCIFVYLIFNQKGTQCAYLPNDRVLAESISKEIKSTSLFTNQLIANRLDEKFVKDSLLQKGRIDFNKSKPQQEPCPEYILYYPEKEPTYEVVFEKCKDFVVFKNLKKL